VPTSGGRCTKPGWRSAWAFGKAIVILASFLAVDPTLALSRIAIQR
jgi:hypothetical protein